MRHRPVRRSGLALGALVWLGLGGAALPAFAAPPPAVYQPITPSQANQTVTLTGKAMTADQVVQIGRFGAKVALSPEAKQRSEDNYGLLLEAATEGVSVYWFNRGAGSERETVIFSGDPMRPDNKAMLEKRQLETFKIGAIFAYGPEVSEEEMVRAMMAVRLNAMTFDAPSPALTQMLTDFLNLRITPVVQSRGTVGEGDLAQMANVGAAMVGAGEVYYQGARMTAAEALQKAGLKPLQPFAADDNALTSSDAYATAQAAIVVHDARNLLEWAELNYAVDLNGMNSSITPMSLPVQSNRPFPWLNYSSARVMEMIKGSYLFGADPKRIIQDPESMRASTHRTGSAWQAWARLRDTVTIQLNSSDHNPAVRTDLKPTDSWELSTPQLMKYYVKGGPQSKGKSGYILSNANWDPYPMANDIEAFTIALANMGVVVTQRIDRFSNPFFTLVTAQQVMKPEELTMSYFAGGGFLATDLWQEIQGAMMPVPPEGNAIVATVEDLQAQTKLKVQRAAKVVDNTYHLLAIDLITGGFWQDLRKVQDPTRQFGTAPTAAVAAMRKVLPISAMPARPPGQIVYEFLKATPASSFYKGSVPMPSGEPTPSAQGR
jgi:histidine ammonia-lyase